MRSLLRSLRHAPDRLAHPARRAAARARVRAMRPTGVVFGCLGNICRSPYAAARFSQSNPRVAVVSAGFIGPDRPSPPEARAAAATRGLDLEVHRSRLFTRDDLLAGRLVVVMEVAHRERLHRELGPVGAEIVLLGDFDPEPIETRTIVDPFGRGSEEFGRAYQRIDRCVASLIDALGPATDPRPS